MLKKTATDWYERRHELEPGMVFRLDGGRVVQLHGRVPGDGTRWEVLDWCDGWAVYGTQIEPGDLVGEPIDWPAVPDSVDPAGSDPLGTDEDMARASAELADEEKRMAAADAAVLETVESLVSPEVFSDILEELKEDGWTGLYEIVGAPVGTPQAGDWPHGELYVDQTCNGGHTGDSYAGTVCIALGNGQWFKFHYAM